MRTALAWLVGLVVWFAAMLALDAAGNAFGIWSSRELAQEMTVTRGSGRYSYEETISSSTSEFGALSGALAFTIAIWAGLATYGRSWFGWMDATGKLKLRAWVLALLSLGALGALLQVAEPWTDALPGFLLRLAVLGLYAGIVIFWCSWYLKRLQRLAGAQ